MLLFASTPDESAAMEQWLVERIPNMEGGSFGPAVFAGVVQRGALVAGVAFHEWRPGYDTLQLSMAAETPRWATRGVIAGLFRYAFVTAGAHKLWTATPASNTRAISFNLGIGMKQEAILRHHFGVKKHAVICSMLAPEWRRSKWFQE